MDGKCRMDIAWKLDALQNSSPKKSRTEILQSDFSILKNEGSYIVVRPSPQKPIERQQKMKLLSNGCNYEMVSPFLKRKNTKKMVGLFYSGKSPIGGRYSKVFWWFLASHPGGEWERCQLVSKLRYHPI